MLSLNFAEIESVDDKCHVAMFGKPGGMMLVIRLVSIRDAVFDNARVTAEIEDGRSRSGQGSRKVQIGRNVQAGQGLKAYSFDHKFLGFSFSRDVAFNSVLGGNGDRQASPGSVLGTSLA